MAATETATGDIADFDCYNLSDCHFAASTPECRSWSYFFPDPFSSCTKRIGAALAVWAPTNAQRAAETEEAV